MHPLKIATQEAKAAGYVIKRKSGGHFIYFHPETKALLPIKQHDFNDNDLKYIRKEIAQNEKRKGR